MPFILMIVRYEVEQIFIKNYRQFFNNIGPTGSLHYSVSNNDPEQEPIHVKRAFRLMQGFITEILDPNLYFSRLSFLESDKSAIDIKHEVGKGKRAGNIQEKMPSISNKYNTRSTLLSNLFEVPCEGVNRARYSDSLEKFNQNM